jgi:hypothetical protein
MVNMKCIVTNLTFSVIGISALSLKYGKLYMKLASITLLLIVALLGNILCIRNKLDLIKYCDIEGLNPNIIDIANIITHWIAPFGLIGLIMGNIKKYKMTNKLYMETVGFIFSLGFIYLGLMTQNMVSNYGLDTQSLVLFSGSFIVLGVTLPKILNWK